MAKCLLIASKSIAKWPQGISSDRVVISLPEGLWGGSGLLRIEGCLVNFMQDVGYLFVLLFLYYSQSCFASFDAFLMPLWPVW